MEKRLVQNNPLRTANKKLINTKSLLVSISLILAFFSGLPSIAMAATLYFSPSSGNFTVGNILNTSVLVNTQGQAINNSSVVINFPTNFLEVISVSKSGSIFSLWVEGPAFSNIAGTISFDGGLPTPGYNGSAGRLLNITFRVRNAGTASLVFSSGAVRANDGLGTDILSGLGSASFTLSAGAIFAPEEIAAPSRLPSKPVIKHEVKGADGEIILVRDSEASDKWVSSRYNKLSWAIPTGVSGISYLFNDRPSSNPGPKSDGFFDNKVYERLDDGIYYAHARFINSLGVGTIEHFKLMVDATPPESFNIILPDGEVTANPTPRIRFETTDKTSGIARYEIKIDGGNWFNAAELKIASYVLPKLGPGEHIILIRAYDKAENYAESQAKIIISAIAAPEVTNYPANIISPGEKLIIKGTAVPKATVEIHMNRKGQSPIVYSAKADKDGNWEAVYENTIPSGAYEVWAKQILESGSESLPSASVYIGVNSWFWRAWQWLKNVGGIVVVSLFFLAGLAVLGYYFAHHFRMWRIKLRREVREAENAVSSGFKKLKKEIKSGKTASKIIKDLSDVEKNIEKEIKDIDKK